MTSTADRLQARPDLFSEPPSPEHRAEYANRRFLQVEDQVDDTALRGIIEPLLPRLAPYTARLVKPHDVSVGLLREGRRFNRIDAGPFDGGRYPDGMTAELARAETAAAFADSGLDDFCHDLVARSQGWVEDLVGHRLRYDRCFLLSYGEGDFIAPHGDTQTSQRIMLQVPVSLNCSTAMRVMREGWMELCYDNPGAVRVHGPGIWHEVLPVQRDPRSAGEPVRVLLTARLPYADA